MQEKSVSSVEIGVFFSLFYVAISFSQVITGPLTDIFGRNRYMIIGLLVTIAGIIIAPVLSMPLVLLALTVASLGMGTFHLASMGFLNEIVPDYLKGTISGAYYFFWGIGMFFGPPIIAKISICTSFKVSMTGYSLFILLVAIGLMISSRYKAEIK